MSNMQNKTQKKEKKKKEKKSGGVMKGKGKQVGAAAAYSTKQVGKAPKISSNGVQCRIQHRELIGSIVGSTNFNINQTFSVNPGLQASFPWLSSQAAGWEQYSFNKLSYEYFTRTGTNVPGSVMLIPDYDAEDAAPDSEQDASSFQNVVEDAPWIDSCCNLDTKAMHSMGPKKFVRTGAAPAGTDIKTYDVANFYVATIDGTAVNWGKLWVEYDVTFYVPSPPPAFLADQHIISLTAPTTANNFGATSSNASAASSNIVTVAGNVLTFQTAGRYLLVYNGSANTSATTTAYPTPAAGATAVAFSALESDATTHSVEAGSGSILINFVNIVSTPVGGTVTYDVTYVSGVAASLLISRLPPSFV